MHHSRTALPTPLTLSNSQAHLRALKGLLKLNTVESGYRAPASGARVHFPKADEPSGASTASVATPHAVAPMQPPVFPVVTPNPLRRVEGLDLTWSSDPFQTDTDKAVKLQEQYNQVLHPTPSIPKWPVAGLHHRVGAAVAPVVAAAAVASHAAAAAAVLLPCPCPLSQPAPSPF